MNFFIADTHFDHRDLLGANDFAPRPFTTVAAMNDALQAAWRARVDDNDVVYHLGDIAMNPEQVPTNASVAALLQDLPGRIVFIKGNHDYQALFKYLRANDPGWHGQPKYAFHAVGTIIKDDHTQFILSHYPMMLGIAKQTLNLHGHIHHSMVPWPNALNVGVDAPERAWLPPTVPWGSPLSAAEIHQLAAAKQAWLAAQQRNTKN